MYYGDQTPYNNNNTGGHYPHQQQQHITGDISPIGGGEEGGGVGGAFSPISVFSPVLGGGGRGGGGANLPFNTPSSAVISGAGYNGGGGVNLLQVLGAASPIPNGNSNAPHYGGNPNQQGTPSSSPPPIIVVGGGGNANSTATSGFHHPTQQQHLAAAGPLFSSGTQMNPTVTDGNEHSHTNTYTSNNQSMASTLAAQHQQQFNRFKSSSKHNNAAASSNRAGNRQQQQQQQEGGGAEGAQIQQQQQGGLSVPRQEHRPSVADSVLADMSNNAGGGGNGFHLGVPSSSPNANRNNHSSNNATNTSSTTAGASASVASPPQRGVMVNLLTVTNTSTTHLNTTNSNTTQPSGGNVRGGGAVGANTNLLHPPAVIMNGGGGYPNTSSSGNTSGGGGAVGGATVSTSTLAAVGGGIGLPVPLQTKSSSNRLMAELAKEKERGGGAQQQFIPVGGTKANAVMVPTTMAPTVTTTTPDRQVMGRGGGGDGGGATSAAVVETLPTPATITRAASAAVAAKTAAYVSSPPQQSAAAMATAGGRSHKVDSIIAGPQKAPTAAAMHSSSSPRRGVASPSAAHPRSPLVRSGYASPADDVEMGVMGPAGGSPQLLYGSDEGQQSPHHHHDDDDGVDEEEERRRRGDDKGQWYSGGKLGPNAGDGRRGRRGGGRHGSRTRRGDGGTDDDISGSGGAYGRGGNTGNNIGGGSAASSAPTAINSSHFSVAPFAAPTSGRLVKRHQEYAGCVARMLYWIVALILVLSSLGIVLILRDHSFNPLLRSKRKLLPFRLHSITQRALDAVYDALPAHGVWIPPTTSTSNLTIDAGTTAYTDLFSHGSYIFHAVDDIHINLTANPNATLYAIDDNDFRNRHSGPSVDRIRYNSLMRAYATRSQQLRRDRIDRVSVRLANEMSICARSARKVGSFAIGGTSGGSNLPNDATHVELMQAAGVVVPTPSSSSSSAYYSRGGFSIATNSHRMPVSCAVDPDDPLVEVFAVTRTRPEDRGPSVPLSSSASAASDPSNRVQSISFAPASGTRLITDSAISVLSTQQYRGLCMQERAYRVEGADDGGDDEKAGGTTTSGEFVDNGDGTMASDRRRYRAANRPADLGRSYAIRRVLSPGSCGAMPVFGGGNSLWGAVRKGSPTDVRVDGTGGDFVGYRGVAVRGVSSVNSNASVGVAALVDSESLSNLMSPPVDSYFSGLTNMLYFLTPALYTGSAANDPPLWLAGNVDVEMDDVLETITSDPREPPSSRDYLDRSEDYLAGWQARVGLPDTGAGQPETSHAYSSGAGTFHDSRKNWQLGAAQWAVIVIIIAWLCFVLLFEGYFALLGHFHRADVRADIASGDWSRQRLLERVIERGERQQKGFWGVFYSATYTGRRAAGGNNGVGDDDDGAILNPPAVGDYSSRQRAGGGVLTEEYNMLGDRVTGFNDAVLAANRRAQMARRELRMRLKQIKREQQQQQQQQLLLQQQQNESGGDHPKRAQSLGSPPAEGGDAFSVLSSSNLGGRGGRGDASNYFDDDDDGEGRQMALSVGTSASARSDYDVLTDSDVYSSAEDRRAFRAFKGAFRQRRSVIATVGFSVVGVVIVGLGMGMVTLAAVREQQSSMAHITESHVRMEARAIATVLSSSLSLFRNESAVSRRRAGDPFPPAFNFSALSSSSSSSDASQRLFDGLIPDRDLHYFLSTANDQSVTALIACRMMRFFSSLTPSNRRVGGGWSSAAPNPADGDLNGATSSATARSLGGHTVSFVRPPAAVLSAQEVTAAGRQTWEGYLGGLNRPNRFSRGLSKSALNDTAAANASSSSSAADVLNIVTPFIALPKKAARFGGGMSGKGISDDERDVYQIYSKDVQSVSSSHTTLMASALAGAAAGGHRWRSSSSRSGGGIGVSFDDDGLGIDGDAREDFNAKAAIPSYALDYLFSNLNAHREISGVSQFDSLPQNSDKLTVFDGHSSHMSHRAVGSTAYAAVYLPSHHVAVFVVARSEMVLDGPGIAGIIAGSLIFLMLVLVAIFYGLSLMQYAPFAEGSVLWRRYGPKIHLVRSFMYAGIFIVLLAGTLCSCYYGDSLRSRAAIIAQEKLTAVYAQTVAAIGSLRNIDGQTLVTRMKTPSTTETLQFTYATDGTMTDTSAAAKIATAERAVGASTSSLLSSTSDSSRVLTSSSAVFAIAIQSPEIIQSLSIQVLAAIAEVFDATLSLSLNTNYYSPSVILDTPTRVSAIKAFGSSAASSGTSTAAATSTASGRVSGSGMISSTTVLSPSSMILSSGSTSSFGRGIIDRSTLASVSASTFGFSSRSGITSTAGSTGASSSSSLRSTLSQSSSSLSATVASTSTIFVEDPTIAMSASTATPTEYDNPLRIRLYGKRSLRYPTPQYKISSDVLFNTTRLSLVQTRWTISSSAVVGTAASLNAALWSRSSSSSSSSSSTTSTSLSSGSTTTYSTSTASSSDGDSTSTDDSSAATSFSDSMRVGYRTYGRASSATPPTGDRAQSGVAPTNWENYYAGAALVVSRIAAVIPSAPAYFAPLVNFVDNTTSANTVVNALIATAIPDMTNGHFGVVVQRLTSESDGSSATRSSSLSPANSGGGSSTFSSPVASSMVSLVERVPLFVSIISMLVIITGVVAIGVLLLEVLFGVMHRLRVAPFGTRARDVTCALGPSSSDEDDLFDGDDDAEGGSHDSDGNSITSTERQVRRDAKRRRRQRGRFLFSHYYDTQRGFPWFVVVGLVLIVSVMCASVPLGGTVLQQQVGDAVTRLNAEEVKWVLEAGRDAVEAAANEALITAARRVAMAASHDAAVARLFDGAVDSSALFYSAATTSATADFSPSSLAGNLSRILGGNTVKRTWSLDPSCMASSRSPSRITNAALYRSLLLTLAHMQEHVSSALPFATSWRLLVQNRSSARARGYGDHTWLSLNPERSIASNIPNFTAGEALGKLQYKFSTMYSTYLANHTAVLKALYNNNTNGSSNSTITSFVPTISAEQAQELRNILLQYRYVASDQLIQSVAPTEYPMAVADLFRYADDEGAAAAGNVSSSSSAHAKRLFDVVTVPGLTTATPAIAHATVTHEENAFTVKKGRIHLSNDDLNAEFSSVFSTPVSHLTALTAGRYNGLSSDANKQRIADLAVPSCPRCAYAAIRLRVGLGGGSMCKGSLTTTRVNVSAAAVTSSMKGGEPSSLAFLEQLLHSQTVDLNDEEDLSFALLLAVDTSAPAAERSRHSTSFLDSEDSSAYEPTAIKAAIGVMNGVIFVICFLLCMVIAWFALESVRHHEEDVALVLLADAVGHRQQQRGPHGRLTAGALSENARQAADAASGGGGEAGAGFENFRNGGGKNEWSDGEDDTTTATSGTGGGGGGAGDYGSDSSDLHRSSEAGGHTALLQQSWKDDASAILYPRGEPFSCVDRTDVLAAACRADIALDTVHMQGPASIPSVLPRSSRTARLFCMVIPIAIALVVGIMHLWMMAALVHQSELEVSRQHSAAQLTFFTSPYAERVLSSAEMALESDGNSALQAANEAVFLGSVAPIGRTHAGVESTSARTVPIATKLTLPLSHGAMETRYNFRNPELKGVYSDAMSLLTSFTTLAANGNTNQSRSSALPDDLDSFVLASSVTTSPYLSAMADASWSPLLQTASVYPANLAAAQSEVANTVAAATFAGPLKQSTLAESQCANFNDCFFSVLRRQFLTEHVPDQGPAFVAIQSIKSRYFSYLNAMPSLVTASAETMLTKVREALRAEREGRILNPTSPTPKTTRAPTTGNSGTGESNYIDATTTTSTAPPMALNATLNGTASNTGGGSSGGSHFSLGDHPATAASATAEEIYANMTDEPLSLSHHTQFILTLAAVEDQIRRLQLLDFIYLQSGLFPESDANHRLANWTVSYTEAEDLRRAPTRSSSPSTSATSVTSDPLADDLPEYTTLASSSLPFSVDDDDSLSNGPAMNPTIQQYGTLFGASLVKRRLFGTYVPLDVVAPFFPLCCAVMNVTDISEETFVRLASSSPSSDSPSSASSAYQQQQQLSLRLDRQRVDAQCNCTSQVVSQVVGPLAFAAAGRTMTRLEGLIDSLTDATLLLSIFNNGTAFVKGQEVLGAFEALGDDYSFNDTEIEADRVNKSFVNRTLGGAIAKYVAASGFASASSTLSSAATASAVVDPTSIAVSVRSSLRALKASLLRKASIVASFNRDAHTSWSSQLKSRSVAEDTRSGAVYTSYGGSGSVSEAAILASLLGGDASLLETATSATSTSSSSSSSSSASSLSSITPASTSTVVSVLSSVSSAAASAAATNVAVATSANSGAIAAATTVGSRHLYFAQLWELQRLRLGENEDTAAQYSKALSQWAPTERQVRDLTMALAGQADFSSFLDTSSFSSGSYSSMSTTSTTGSAATTTVGRNNAAIAYTLLGDGSFLADNSTPTALVRNFLLVDTQLRALLSSMVLTEASPPSPNFLDQNGNALRNSVGRGGTVASASSSGSGGSYVQRMDRATDGGRTPLWAAPSSFSVLPAANRRYVHVLSSERRSLLGALETLSVVVVAACCTLAAVGIIVGALNSIHGAAFVLAISRQKAFAYPAAAVKRGGISGPSGQLSGDEGGGRGRSYSVGGVSMDGGGDRGLQHGGGGGGAVPSNPLLGTDIRFHRLTPATLHRDADVRLAQQEREISGGGGGFWGGGVNVSRGGGYADGDSDADDFDEPFGAGRSPQNNNASSSSSSSVRRLISGGLLWFTRSTIGTFNARGEAVELLEINKKGREKKNNRNDNTPREHSSSDDDDEDADNVDRGEMIVKYLRRYETNDLRRREVSFINRFNKKYFARIIRTSLIGGLATLAVLLGFSLIIHSIVYDSIHYESHFIELDDVIYTTLTQIADVRFKLLLSRSAHARDLAALGLQLTAVTADTSVFDAVELPIYEHLMDNTLKRLYGPLCGKETPHYCDMFARSGGSRADGEGGVGLIDAVGEGGGPDATSLLSFGSSLGNGCFDKGLPMAEVDPVTGGSSATHGPVVAPNVCQLVKVPMATMAADPTAGADAASSSSSNASSSLVVNTLYSYRLQCPRVIVPPSSSYSSYPNVEGLAYRGGGGRDGEHFSADDDGSSASSLTTDFASLTSQNAAMSLQFPSQQLLLIARSSAASALNTILVALEGSKGLHRSPLSASELDKATASALNRKMRRRQRVILTLLADKLDSILGAVDALQAALREEVLSTQEAVVFAAQQREVLFNMYSRTLGMNLLEAEVERWQRSQLLLQQQQENGAAARSSSSLSGGDDESSFVSPLNLLPAMTPANDPSLLFSGTEGALLLGQQVRAQNYALGALTSMALDSVWLAMGRNSTYSNGDGSNATTSSVVDGAVNGTSFNSTSNNSTSAATASGLYVDGSATASGPLFALTASGESLILSTLQEESAAATTATSTTDGSTPASSTLLHSLMEPLLDDPSVIDAFIDALAPLSAFAATEPSSPPSPAVDGDNATAAAVTDSSSSSSRVEVFSAQNAFGVFLSRSSDVLAQTTNGLVRCGGGDADGCSSLSTNNTATAAATASYMHVSGAGAVLRRRRLSLFEGCAAQYVPLYFYDNTSAATLKITNDGDHDINAPSSSASTTTLDWLDAQFTVNNAGGSSSSSSLASTVAVPDPCAASYDTLFGGLVAAVRRLSYLDAAASALANPLIAEVGHWATLAAHQSSTLSPTAHSDYREVVMRALFMTGPQRLHMQPSAADDEEEDEEGDATNATTLSYSSPSSNGINAAAATSTSSVIDAFSVLLDPMPSSSALEASEVRALGKAARRAIRSQYFYAESGGGNSSSDGSGAANVTALNGTVLEPSPSYRMARAGLVNNVSSFAAYITGGHMGLRGTTLSGDALTLAATYNADSLNPTLLAGSSNSSSANNNYNSSAYSASASHFSASALLSLGQLRLQTLLPVTATGGRGGSRAADSSSSSMPLLLGEEGPSAARFARQSSGSSSRSGVGRRWYWSMRTLLNLTVEIGQVTMGMPMREALSRLVAGASSAAPSSSAAPPPAPIAAVAPYHRFVHFQPLRTIQQARELYVRNRNHRSYAPTASLRTSFTRSEQLLQQALGGSAAPPAAETVPATTTVGPATTRPNASAPAASATVAPTSPSSPSQSPSTTSSVTTPSGGISSSIANRASHSFYTRRFGAVASLYQDTHTELQRVKMLSLLCMRRPIAHTVAPDEEAALLSEGGGGNIDAGRDSGLGTLHQTSPRSPIGNEKETARSRSYTDRQSLIRSWFSRQLASLAVGGGSGSSSTGVSSASTSSVGSGSIATTAGVITGVSDVIFSPAQIGSAQALWSRRVAASGAAVAVPPTLAEVLRVAGVNPFAADQRYFSADAQRALSRLIGTSADPSSTASVADLSASYLYGSPSSSTINADGTTSSSAHDDDSPLSLLASELRTADESRVRSESELLRETILWLTVAVPSAFAEVHARADHTGCAPFYMPSDALKQSSSSSLRQYFGSVFSELDANISSSSSSGGDSSSILGYSSSTTACTSSSALTSLPIQAEQMLMQLVEGYASTVLMLDGTDDSLGSSLVSTGGGEDAGADADDEDVGLLSGTSWYDSLLSSRTLSGGSGVGSSYTNPSSLLARAGGMRVAVWAHGLSYTMRVVQWLTILMLWCIGAVSAWMYYRFGLHRD